VSLLRCMPSKAFNGAVLIFNHSLDRQTEAFVDELLRTEFADWTAIVIAHRLKTIADFDKVLVLQDGNVIEFDSPKNLLARDSMFKTLWDLQEK
jgi:ATP-binding cassette, subfamily C (CFTR/MRP), member 1